MHAIAVLVDWKRVPPRCQDLEWFFRAAPAVPDGSTLVPVAPPLLLELVRHLCLALLPGNRRAGQRVAGAADSAKEA
jgi:hypothetical protein